MKVLFVVFNRPDLTRVVLSRIRDAKPARLYVFADGPRYNKLEDVNKCKRVRSIISEEAGCPDVRTQFIERNLGPLHSVKCALDWYFNHEDDGIIIEDDCLPDMSFFSFCEELLSKYRENKKIFMISGSNFIPNHAIQFSYLFSRLTLIWGWATWKRSWLELDTRMKEWPNYIKTKDLDYFGKHRELVFRLINEQYLNPKLLTWGTLWRATFLINRGVSIIPKNNLVRNIGFGHPDATRHRRYHRVSETPVEPIRFPLTHPPDISPDKKFDEKSLDFYYCENNVNS